MKLGPPSTTEPSWRFTTTKYDDPLLKEIDEYTTDPMEEMDSVDCILDREDGDDEDVVATVGAIDPLGDICQYMGGMISSYSASLMDVPLASMSSDPNMHSFTVDSKALKTQSCNILKT